MRWVASRTVLFLLVIVNLASIGAAEMQRSALMRRLYDEHTAYTNMLDKRLDRIDGQLRAWTAPDAPGEILARVQKIQIELERMTAQLTVIQGNTKSSQVIIQQQRPELTEINSRLNHIEHLIQHVAAGQAQSRSAQ